MPNLEGHAAELQLALLSLDRLSAERILRDAAGSQNQVSAAEELVAPVLSDIGARWERGQVALSQVYMAGRICQELVDKFLPLLPVQEERKSGIAIAVLEDYHMLGKRMVYSVLRAAGIGLLDYGRVEAGDLALKVLQDDIDILLISTLMLPSALQVKGVTSRLLEARPRTRVVVGGAPFRFDAQLWREVGAHAFGRDTAEALSIVNRLIKDRHDGAEKHVIR